MSMKIFNRYITILLAGALMFSLSSCNWWTKESQEYDKSLIIYMAANNNLTSYAISNLKSIKEGFVPKYEGDKKGSVLLVYYHLTGENPVLLRIFKDEEGVVREERVVEYEYQNSTSADVMSSVLDKVATLFPAKENGLIMWSHGTGWLPKRFYANPTRSSGDFAMQMTLEEDPYAHLVKSFGEDQGNGTGSNVSEMDIVDMAAAMPVKYHYVIFDCCLMGGIEVAYEMKDVCDYIIASPTEILANGFPYDKIMEPLLKGASADLKKVCETYYDHYNSQSGDSKSATIALIKTSGLENLANSFKALFDAGGRDAIDNLNMGTIQRYYRMDRRWFFDMGNFAKDIAADINRSDLYSGISSSLSNAVIYKAATEKFITIPIDPAKYSGLSTYINNSSLLTPLEKATLDEYYKKFAWNKACGMI